MQVEFSRPFVKTLAKCQKKIQIAFRTRLALFIANPFDARLNNHSLNGEYLACRSINITGDWRAVYKQIENGVYFVALGAHGKLYR